MPPTVYILTETINKAIYTFWVFADRKTAFDAGLCHAERRIARCRAMDKITFGTDVPAGTYSLRITNRTTESSIAIVYESTGDSDAVAWQVRAFDVLGLTPAHEAEQPDLFVVTA